MDAANLRRKDTTKGPPLRVLSLDGGGVRGYSMLIILKELMHRAFVETEGRPPRHEEIPKPCDYFDLIGGTGTGGLIAIMLGRLRLDLDTSMDVYVRMTRKVFETDKTIAGIPYKTTLFKASKLEEAIKACVREHTIYEDEGNDGTAIMSPASGIGSAGVMSPADMRRSLSMKSTASLPQTPGNRISMGSSIATSYGVRHWGDPDARLYDGREFRTKTAVTAVYKGTPKSGSSVLLRSYDSRKEPAPEYNCTIWQAGRATSATGLAFKPIQIGQSVFIDEGAGKYNPSPQLLEEAAVNEWPGREIGVFVSVGTGKRPGGTNANQHEWWEGFIGGSVGSFAEARRRLIAKIEDCEATHVQMMNVELPKRGVPLDNYCRLNVEVGVGEFGMNEWDRMPEMTTNTNKYLKSDETQRMIGGAAHRIARAELMKRRMDASIHQPTLSQGSHGPNDAHLPTIQGPQHSWPAAVELPGSDVHLSPSPQQHYLSPSTPPYPDDQTVSSHESGKYVTIPYETKQRLSAELPARTSIENIKYSPQQVTSQAPPLPPKTPINDGVVPTPPRLSPLSFSSRPNGPPRLPYPEDDGPPPPVNKLRKPDFVPR